MKNPWKQYSKINPQREDGNRQIANDVYGALMSADLSGSEFRIVMAVINKTWGFGKDSDCISTAQFQEMTGLAERTIKKSIKSLKDKRVLVYAPSNIRVHHGSPLNEFIFNKHYDTWKTQGCTNVHACTKVSSKGAQTGKVRVHDRSPTKENIQKKITKETIRSNDFDLFWNAYPKKIGKKSCLKKWRVLCNSKDPPKIDTILNAITHQKATDQWQRGYIPNPETWINQGRWEDEINVTQGNNGNGGNPHKPRSQAEIEQAELDKRALAAIRAQAALKNTQNTG